MTSVRAQLSGSGPLVSAPTPVLGLFAGMAAAALVVALGVLAGAGELAPVPAGLPDPGPLVRVGLPVARALHDLAAALTIGLLVLTVWAVAPDRGASSEMLEGPRLAMLKAASVAAGAWLLSAATVLTFTAAELAGLPVGAPGFAESATIFVTRLDLGRALWVSALLVTAAAMVTVVSARVASAACAAGLALLALLPLALTGHASGGANHENAATSLALHLLGVSVWVGGLGAVLLMARSLGPQLPAVVRRYSTMAGWCFAVVALSGLLSAALRLGSLSKVTSLYGLLALGKVVALGLLGLAGWRHRVAVLPRLEGSRARRAFLRLAGVEIVVMGATMGLAVALSRSAPPAAGHAGAGSAGVAPPLTVDTYLTQVKPDLLWLTVAAVGLACYGWGLLAVRRHGGRWGTRRTVAWVAGCLALAFLTSGGPAVYARNGFSAHMLQHLGLTLLVPLLLVLGSPLTLALRTLPSRTDGSVGLRETLQMVLRSRFLGVLRDPVTAAAGVAGGVIAFYYIPSAFSLSLATHTGHVAMTVYFLAAGALFVWVLRGADQGPAGPTHPLQLRLMSLALTGALLVSFGVTLQRSSTVLAAGWWERLGLTDRGALLQDQSLGGAMAWMAGALLMLLAAGTLGVRRGGRRGAQQAASLRSAAGQERVGSSRG